LSYDVETIFESFDEFHFLTRNLNDFQKEKLLNSLSDKERMFLCQFINKEENDISIINQVDYELDSIKARFDIDLISIRIKVLSGEVYKIRKDFWEYININLINKYSYFYIKHIFNGVSCMPLDNSYVLLVPSIRRPDGKESC
jgi:hypothetical protein